MSESLGQPRGLDEKTFKTELSKCRPRLLSYAISLTKNTELAEDMVQATSLKMFEARGGFRVGASMLSWAIAILTNTYRDYMSKRAMRNEIGGEQFENAIDGTESPDAELGDAFDLRRTAVDVNEAIETLPPRQREALEDVINNEMTHSEAAKKRGLSKGTISRQVSDARGTLKKSQAGKDALEILGAKKLEERAGLNNADNLRP
ncbi:MAG: RNA polymerase sigma factor [Candidatus Kaiserbacteria bacterium]|nr:RNA polymerase sigma factor [Candidatus Kaiserbacteria bacterium]